MPFVDLPNYPLTSTLDPARVPVTPDEHAAAEASRPSIGDTWGASIRTQNEIGSIYAREDVPNPKTVEDGFNPYTYNKGTKYETLTDQFADVHNQASAEALRRQIDREEEDRRTVAASGFMGFLTDAAAGLLSPTTLLPGGAVIKSGKAGISIAKSAASVAAANVAATAAQEAMLHSSQETRTGTETAFALGSSALLGGFIGGGVAALMSKAERSVAEKAVSSLTSPATPFGASAGAASAVDLSKADLTIDGKAARSVAQVTEWLNPNLRLNGSPSTSARLFGQQLAENSVYQAGNEAGRTSGPAVERLARQTHDARIYATEKGLDQDFRAMRKSGGNMIRSDFEEAVGRAARRNDEGENEFVSSAAKRYRSEMIEPYKKEAISAGLLDENVKTETADSYLHRMWDFQKLTAQESRFKEIVRGWVKQTARDLPEDKSFVDMDDYARYVADLVYDKLTGRANEGTLAGLNITMGPRGPLKERTFNIPDALVEEFLNNNIVEVGRRYARLMSADVELTRRFGGIGLKDPRAKVADEYRALRERVSKAQTLDEIRDVTGKGFKVEGLKEKAGKGHTIERQREMALDALAKREKADLRDLDALRDLIRGTYGNVAADNAWVRISRAASQFNYLRLMGGVIVASLSDVYRPAMVHGLLPFMREGIAPLFTAAGRAARGLSVDEARKFGVVVERYTQGRLATFAEIGDPYKRGTSAERLLENGTRVASRWNGITMWTDAMKSIGAVMSQNRIIKGLKGEGDTRFLAYLGLDAGMRQRIKAQLDAHAEELEGIWVAHSDEWDDAEAARHFGAAIGKDVDSIIVSKSVGDVPLFANTPTGRLLVQFKSFALASHQKVLLRGLQESPTRFVSGMVGLSTLGLMTSYLRAWRGGSERNERFRKTAENPGYLLGEALDNTGIFAVPMEAANMFEKILGVNPIKDPMKAAFPQANQQGSSLRYASRGVASTFLGPSAGLIDIASEVAKLTAMKAAGETTDAQTKRLKKQAVQLVPYYSYPGMREILNSLHIGE